MPTITVDPSAYDASTKAAKAKAEARKLVKLRKREAADVTHALDALNARLLRGDDAVTAIDLVNADAEVKRADLLNTYAERLLRRAERNTSPGDYEVATHVATILVETGTYDTNVTITDKVPAAVDKRTLPHTFIVQRRHSVGLDLESVHLEVILYSKSKMLTSPQTDEITRPLVQRGWEVSAMRSLPEELDGGVWRHAVTLDVSKGWGQFPATRGGNFYELHYRVPDAAMEGLHHYGVRLAGYGLDGTLLESTVDGDRITERWALGFGAAFHGEVDAAKGAAGRALRSLVDTYIPGFGLVADVKLTDASPLPGRRDVNVKLTDHVGAHTADVAYAVVAVQRSNPAPELFMDADVDDDYDYDDDDDDDFQ
ncbi:hypothetical protein PCC79_16165 [Propioniciclava soli]|uniref:Uncharacterized protein n=1 Tax=Propioniciclava soli TaxID=2775081 RepID=A0ABZ3C778_9ACTN